MYEVEPRYFLIIFLVLETLLFNVTIFLLFFNLYGECVECRDFLMIWKDATVGSKCKLTSSCTDQNNLSQYL